MADENYKLAKFQAAVFAEVDLKTSQIKQEAELLKEQELEKNKDLQLDKSYNFIQKRSSEIKKHYKREVAKFSLLKKRELLNRRGDITARVFDNVATMLDDFTKKVDYKAFLLNSVRDFIAKNNPSEVSVYLKPCDMAFADEIKAVFSCPVSIEQSNDIKIGGFIASNSQKGLYFDETLEQKLADQKAFFMEKSEFVL